MNRLRLPLFALVLATASLAGACGGSPSSPALTDPTEILTAALTSTEAAKSVHLDVRVDGTATVALPGVTAGSGMPVTLDGTTAAVDVDFAAPAARATLSAPALLGFKVGWSLTRIVLVMLAGCVPFLSFWVERKVAAEVEGGLAAARQ